MKSIAVTPISRLCGLAASIIVTSCILAPAAAQEARERERPSAPRERERGERQPEAQFAPPDRGEREGTPEGMPKAQIAPRDGDFRPRILPPRSWLLGVHAYNTDHGVAITHVLPRSPAWEAGLERGDVIVAVDGFQVGYVNGRLYTLGQELQHRAGPRGEVLLLVQNVRNRRLVNLDVRLERDRDIYAAPRER
ncbi:MAG: PDZ domain-containing protein [Planctomycetes bacterium]|nr:PDZ domain-containing protein [Planctomycetota bacterium]